MFITIVDANTKLCQGKDIFERMNYLYQVIIILNGFYILLLEIKVIINKKLYFQASYLMALKNRVAASYYGNVMVGCAKKSVLRM